MSYLYRRQKTSPSHRHVDKQNSLIYQYKPSDVLNEIITPLTLVRTGSQIQDKAACQN